MTVFMMKTGFAVFAAAAFGTEALKIQTLVAEPRALQHDSTAQSMHPMTARLLSNLFPADIALKIAGHLDEKKAKKILNQHIQASDDNYNCFLGVVHSFPIKNASPDMMASMKNIYKQLENIAIMDNSRDKFFFDRRLQSYSDFLRYLNTEIQNSMDSLYLNFLNYVQHQFSIIIEKNKYQKNFIDTLYPKKTGDSKAKRKANEDVSENASKKSKK